MSVYYAIISVGEIGIQKEEKQEDLRTAVEMTVMDVINKWWNKLFIPRKCEGEWN